MNYLEGILVPRNVFSIPLKDFFFLSFPKAFRHSCKECLKYLWQCFLLDVSQIREKKPAIWHFAWTGLKSVSSVVGGPKPHYQSFLWECCSQENWELETNNTVIHSEAQQQAAMQSGQRRWKRCNDIWQLNKSLPLFHIAVLSSEDTVFWI